MLATDSHLIPLAQLCKHESTVLERLAALPTRYSRSLLEVPEIRYPFLYYALLTHWPDLLGELSDEDVLYNRSYWLFRLKKKYQADHDFDDDFDQEILQLSNIVYSTFDTNIIEELEQKVLLEVATKETELPVAYSEFSIRRVKKVLGVHLDEKDDYFASVGPISVSPLLLETLKRSMRFANASSTEKARSELIVSPLLLEVANQLHDNISVFSGVELEADPEKGLRGVCDFLMCQSPHQLVLESPIVAVVEAKRADVSTGIGQCIAEMVAARLFNQQNNSNIPILYGIVTSGTNWRFLRLIDSTAYIDISEYHIKEVERIVGIIVSMFKSSGVTV